MSSLPILYSFRRCPYAIRTRMAMAVAAQDAEIREVLLRNKPEHMLEVGNDGTVPILIMQTPPEPIDEAHDVSKVLENSLDIMDWALHVNDPLHWLQNRHESDLCTLLEINDGPFKLALDQYKYPTRFSNSEARGARERTIDFASAINGVLDHRRFLSGEDLGFFDAAIFPFVRQWFAVDPRWSESLDLPHLLRWHHKMIKDFHFTTVMAKLNPWQPGDSPRRFLETLI